MITYNIFHTLDIFQRNLLLFQMYKMECSGGAPGMLNTESQNINMLKPPATPKNAQATSAFNLLQAPPCGCCKKLKYPRLYEHN